MVNGTNGEAAPRIADLARTIELSTKVEADSANRRGRKRLSLYPLNAYRFRESREWDPFRRCYLSAANEAITRGDHAYIEIYGRYLIKNRSPLLHRQPALARIDEYKRRGGRRTAS